MREIQENEYILNNEIYCSMCNTPKTFTFENHKHIPINCSCAKKKFEEESLKRKQQEEQIKARSLKNISSMNEMYQRMSFETLDMNRPESFVKAVKFCKQYAKDLADNYVKYKKEGVQKGLYLYGTCGLGKTLLSSCIANYLINERGLMCLFTTYGKLEEKTLDFNTPELFWYQLKNVPLLIIDDLGTERFIKSDGSISKSHTKFHEIIDYRYSSFLPTIFNSNNTVSELCQEYGLMVKTADRINAMCQGKITLTGTSYRAVRKEK